MEYYPAIKKNEIMPFAETWMDLEIIILSEVSQTKTNIIWYSLYEESKKRMIQMNLFTKQKQTQRLREWTCGYQWGRVEGKNRLGVWNWYVHTAIFKIDNQQGPAVKKIFF